MTGPLPDVGACTAVLAAAVAAAAVGRPRVGRLGTGHLGTGHPGTGAPATGPVAGTAREDRPRRRWAPVLAGVVAWLVLGGVAGVVAGVVLGAWLTRRAPEAAEPDVGPDLALLVLLVRLGLRSGADPARALAVAARAVPSPAAAGVLAAVDRLGLGDDPARVWADLSRRPGLAPLGRALLRAHDSGAAVGATVGRLAEELDRDRRAVAERRARAVGVRAAVPLGVCLLPSFVLLGVVPLAAGLLRGATG